MHWYKKNRLSIYDSGHNHTEKQALYHTAWVLVCEGMLFIVMGDTHWLECLSIFRRKCYRTEALSFLPK